MNDHANTPETNEEADDLVSPARRRLLAKAGTYAVVTPPAISFMLSTALAGQQVTRSGGCSATWLGHRSNSGHRGPHRPRNRFFGRHWN